MTFDAWLGSYTNRSTYEHVQVFVKDYPKWFDRGTYSSNVTPSKKRASTSNHGPGIESAETTSNLHNAPEMAGNAWQGARSTGTKAAKEAQKNLKAKKAAAYKQAKAIEVLTKATLRKTALMEEHNLILLITATDAQGQPSTTATEFLALRQKEELQKLKMCLKLQEAAEEARVQSEIEQATCERAEAAAEELTNNKTSRQVREAGASGGNTNDLDETRCSDDVAEDGEDENMDILGFQSSGSQLGAGMDSEGGGSQFEFTSLPPPTISTLATNHRISSITPLHQVHLTRQVPLQFRILVLSNLNSQVSRPHVRMEGWKWYNLNLLALGMDWVGCQGQLVQVHRSPTVASNFNGGQEDSMGNWLQSTIGNEARRAVAPLDVNGELGILHT